MSTILGKDAHELKAHYSLRKLGTGLASVLIGLNLFEVTTKSQKVKADTFEQDETNIKNNHSAQNTDQFIVLGKIIPVDNKNNAIKGAPQPHYRRDPNDSAKAIATPAPKVKGYRIAKNGQSENYDRETNLVTPPADPSQDTQLLYSKKIIKKKTTGQKKHSLKSKEITSNNSQTINSQNSPVSEQEFVNRDQQVKESVQKKTRLFGFGRKKKQEDLQENTKNKNVEANDHKVAKSDNAKSKKVTGKDKDHLKENNEVSKHAPQNTQGSEKHDKKKHKKSENSTFEKPEAVMNPETKIPPKPLTATVKIVDQEIDNHLLTELTCEGHPGDPIIFDNLKQVVEIHNYDGYELGSLINADIGKEISVKDLDHIDLGKFTEDDAHFILHMRHKKIKLTTENCAGKVDPEQLSYEVKLTVHYQGAGDKTPADKIEKAVWSRTKTYDIVSKKMVIGKFDTDWSANPQAYPPVVVPDVEGYQADLVETSVIPVKKESIKKVVTYKAIDIPDVAPKLANSEMESQPSIPDKLGSEQVDASDYEKEAFYTVSFSGAGEATPKEHIEKVTWTRSLKVTEDSNLVNTPWSQDKEYFDDVTVPVISGYHADQKEVKGPLTTQEDINHRVTYTPNGFFVPVDQMGQRLGNEKQFITDPDDASMVLPHEELPTVSGYKAPTKYMDPYDAGKDQQVFYSEITQYSLVDIDHPNEHVEANNYVRTFKFTIEFVGAGEQTPDSIVQEIKWHRTVTLDNHGQLVKDGKFDTDWRPEINRYDDVVIPKISGYETAKTLITGPEAQLKDQKVVITYQEIQETEPVKQVTEPVQPQTTSAPKPTEPAKSLKQPVTEPAITEPVQKSSVSHSSEISDSNQLSNNEISQTIHFIDTDGNTVAPDHEDLIKFSKDENGNWTKKIDTFSSVTVPVVKGYFADKKQVKGKSVMPDDQERNPELSVTYRQFGQIIPIDINGDIITDPDDEDKSLSQRFVNDPNDASRALEKQAVPQIKGWKASVKTVSPVDPAINIPVMYSEED